MKNREGVFDVFLSSYIVVYIIYMVVCLYFTRMYNICTSTLQLKCTLANGNPPFSKQGNTSTFHRREVMGWNLFASVSQQVYRRRRKYVRVCSRLFVTVRWHCLHIYHILLHNVSKLFFRHVCCWPKRFCPFDPFGVWLFVCLTMRLCLGMPLCYIYTHTMQADAWILSLCVSFGCYLQMWCVNVWNHVCIRWEQENSKRYSRSA